MQRIAIYDMDKTITRTATFGPFLRHAARTGNPLRFGWFPVFGIVALGHWLLAKAGCHPGDYRKSIKRVGFSMIVGKSLSAAEARLLGEAFARETMAHNALPAALGQIIADRAAGYRLVLASASNRIYVEAVARALGFEVAICTDNAVTADGRVLAAIPGPNCYGAAKLCLVQDWMQLAGLKRTECHIRFYSDHVTDAPCLDWADEAFVTNPHAPLRALALRKGWPVLDWN